MVGVCANVRVLSGKDLASGEAIVGDVFGGSCAQGAAN
jgi:hypothetical protein